MAAETAAARFVRDTAYKTVDPSDARWEDGSDRFARNEVSESTERTDREYVDENGDSAESTYIAGL